MVNLLVQKMGDERRRARPYWIIILVAIVIIPYFLWMAFSRKTEIQTLCESEECLAAAINLEKSINPEVRPCDDFYEYACGNWPKNYGKSNLSTSTMQLMMEKNLDEILEFLKKKNSQGEPQAVHKIRKIFDVCMNSSSYGGSDRVYNILNRNGVPFTALTTQNSKKFDHVAAIANLTRIAGIKMFFDVSVLPNPYNKSENAIWLSKPSLEVDPDIMPLSVQEEAKVKEADPWKPFLAELQSKLCNGTSKQHCLSWNDDVLEKVRVKRAQRLYITAIARKKFNSTTSISSYTLEGLQKMTDHIALKHQPDNNAIQFNWTRYIEMMFSDLNNVALNLSDPSKVRLIVMEPSFLEDMLEHILNMDEKTMQLAIWWEVMYTLLPYTDWNLFEKKALLEYLPREQRCVKIITSAFGPAISYLHVEKGKYAEIKSEVTEMFTNIKRSFKEILSAALWMGSETKNNALKKLDAVKPILAYPDIIERPKELDGLFEDVDVTGDFFEIMINKISNGIKKKLSKLNKANDLNETDWTLPPNVVNAFYVPMDNSMFLPLGILGAPIYSHSLKALDYGSIGQIVGHELTHGFDNFGKEFDETGELKRWWKELDSTLFAEKSNCFVKAYEKYNTNSSGVLQQVNTRSSITINEDISDNVGFKLALTAYRQFESQNGKEAKLKKFEKFTHEQLFTLGYANFWCEQPTAQKNSIFFSMMDHSPNPVRVNGVFRNSEEFAKIWNCPKDSAMNAAEKCSIW